MYTSLTLSRFEAYTVNAEDYLTLLVLSVNLHFPRGNWTIIQLKYGTSAVPGLGVILTKCRYFGDETIGLLTPRCTRAKVKIIIIITMHLNNT